MPRKRTPDQRTQTPPQWRIPAPVMCWRTATTIHHCLTTPLVMLLTHRPSQPLSLRSPTFLNGRPSLRATTPFLSLSKGFFFFAIFGPSFAIFFWVGKRGCHGEEGIIEGCNLFWFGPQHRFEASGWVYWTSMMTSLDLQWRCQTGHQSFQKRQSFLLTSWSMMEMWGEEPIPLCFFFAVTTSVIWIKLDFLLQQWRWDSGVAAMFNGVAGWWWRCQNKGRADGRLSSNGIGERKAIYISILIQK